MSPNEPQVTSADQNEREYQLAASVAQHVTLKNIYLKAISAELKESRADIVAAISSKELAASVDWRASHEFDENELVLTVKLDVNIRVGQKPHILMTCSYLLEYGLDSAPPGDLRDDLLEAFSKVNGVYNAWPYLREIFQTTCARMSVPPPLLPIYRVVRPFKAPKSDGSQTEEPSRDQPVRAGT